MDEPSQVVNNNYERIPNITVQNIKQNETVDNSYIQLFGRRTVEYFYTLLKLRTYSEYINFSIDMILWKMNINNNKDRERKYLKDFLVNIHKNNLIILTNNIDLANLKSNDFVEIKMNIYEYNETGQVQKYFELQKIEYDKIMKEYSGDLDRHNLLNLFCNIKSRIYRNRDDVGVLDRHNEVAYPPYKTISDDIFIENQKTLKQYIDCLVELDLIRYDCAGDMQFNIDGRKPIRQKANFTYTLYRKGWETELDNAISSFRKKKRKDGWSFLSKPEEIDANEKRRISQKINMFERLEEQGKLTQSQNKELLKLKRQKEKWQYDIDVDVRKLEEEKLLVDNPDKPLSEIYEDMGYERKFDRAQREEENNDTPESLKITEKLNGDYDIKSLILFLPIDSPYIEDNTYVNNIHNQTMTIKEFFEDVCLTHDYSEFLEFKAKKNNYNLIDIGAIGTDDWGEPEPKYKKCICCGENYEDMNDGDTWCPECIAATRRNNLMAQEQKYEYQDFDW